MNNDYILIITLHADPTTPSGVKEGGGTHSYIRELVAGLVLKNKKSIVVTRKSSADLESYVKINSVNSLYRIKIGPISEIDKKLLNSYHNDTLKEIVKIINKEGIPSVIHSVYWNSGRAAMDLSQKYNINYVHTIISNGIGRIKRGADNQDSQRIEIEKLVFNNAYKIFSISEDERNDLIKYYDIPSIKIIVVGRVVSIKYLSLPHDKFGNPKKYNDISINEYFK